MARAACELQSLVKALNERSVAAVTATTTPGVTLAVTGGPTVSATSNEHLWRAVSVQGQDELERYLVDLYETLPGLTFSAAQSADQAGAVVARAEAAGIDRDGLPFETAGAVRLELQDGLVSSAEVRLDRVVVGGELLRGGAPERYLRHLLNAPSVAEATRGAA